MKINNKKEKLLNHSRLVEALRYDKTLGTFFWKEDRHSNKIKGKEAGTIHFSGYRIIGLDGITYFAHRLAWFYMHKKWPKDQIDHINHNRLDNHIANLKEALPQQNSCNQKMRITNKSGVMGVYWNKAIKKWHAHIRTRGRQIHLGYFNNLEEAAMIRKQAEVQYGFHPNHGIKVGVAQ